MDKDFIERVFSEVIDNINADEKTIAQYFSPSYVQYVDGHRLDYNGFCTHMMMQKQVLVSAKTTIHHVVVEGNSICTVHRVDAVKKNGESLSVKVIAYFEVKEGKLVLCDELTHLLKGDKGDENIGSVH